MPRPVYRIRRTCEQCGKSFIVYPSWQGRKFCSHACYWASLLNKPHLPVQDRFWLKIEKTDTCWLWQGSTAGYGYGVLSVGSGVKKTVRRIPAHRFSWELHNGPIPEGMEVCHNCPGGDKPSCVNPAHLFLGSHKTNMLDALAKGRMPQGARNGQAKLTEDQVREIRRLHAAGAQSQRALGCLFGVSHSLIGSIVTGQRWKHVK